MKQYGDMKEHVVGEIHEITTAIIPATGWNAIFVDEDDGHPVLLAEQVVCWALVSIYDNHYSMNPEGSRVVGFVASQGLGPADDLDNFVDYLPIGADQSGLQSYAAHILEHVKEDMDKEDREERS